jgi:hypothetical protein
MAAYIPTALVPLHKLWDVAYGKRKHIAGQYGLA